MYSSEHVWDLRWREREVRVAAGAQPRPVAGVAGRRGAHLPQRERLAAVRRLHAVALLPPQSQRRQDARPVRAADRADGCHGVSGAEQPRRQPRLPRSVLSRGRDVDRHSGSQRADHLSWRRLSQGAARQRVHPRLADQSRAPHGGDRRWVGPADGEERLRARRVSRVLGRTVPSGEPRSTGPTATCMSSTCTAASCRRAASGARTSPTTSRRTRWSCPSAGGGSGAWSTASASAKRPAPPALSKATPQQLVQTLSNPKGWWRDTAQRLLVERGDATVAPALKTLAASAP